MNNLETPVKTRAGAGQTLQDFDGPKSSSYADQSDMNDIFVQLERLIEQQSEKSVIETLTDIGTPVCSVAIMDAGKTTARVLGAPCRETIAPAKHTTPYDKDTLFQACSISKSICALALMKLCRDEILDLETPIRNYLSEEQLSWISTPRTKLLVAGITLRQLVSHTSGLSSHGFAGYQHEPIPTVEQILRGDYPANSTPVRLNLMPGTKFSYSGGGFVVIQCIMESVLNKPFPQIMDEVVFKPLKMTRSTYQNLPDGEVNFAPAFWNGNTPATPGYHILPERAADSLWTTPSDLLKAVHAVQQSLDNNSNSFIGAEWAREMLTEVDGGMGLGWFVKKGGVKFEHTGGNDPGYRCIVVGCANLPGSGGDLAAKGQGICVMTNSQMGDILHKKVVAAVSYLKKLPALLSLDAEKFTVTPFVDYAKSCDDRVEEWCGDWGPGDWTLEYDEGPSLRYGKTNRILMPAAIMPAQYDQGTSIDMVADGLGLMVRLGWKDGEQIVEIWQDEGKQLLQKRKT